MIYKKLGKAEQTNKGGGYKPEIFFCPTDKFTLIQKPVLSGTPAIGEKFTIATAHTFGANDGFFALLCKKHSVTSKMATVGDDGAQEPEWTFEGIILGDGAIPMEVLTNMLNDECIFLLKDQDCLNTDGFVQFGDECNTPTIKLEFDGKTTAEGQKEYKLTGTVRSKKYFYNATVTEAA